MAEVALHAGAVQHVSLVASLGVARGAANPLALQRVAEAQNGPAAGRNVPLNPAVGVHGVAQVHRLARSAVRGAVVRVFLLQSGRPLPGIIPKAAVTGLEPPPLDAAAQYRLIARAQQYRLRHLHGRSISRRHQQAEMAAAGGGKADALGLPFFQSEPRHGGKRLAVFGSLQLAVTRTALRARLHVDAAGGQGIGVVKRQPGGVARTQRGVAAGPVGGRVAIHGILGIKVPFTHVAGKRRTGRHHGGSHGARRLFSNGQHGHVVVVVVHDRGRGSSRSSVCAPSTRSSE